MSTSTQSKSPASTIHNERFPAESAEYRTARNTLLEAEMELRRNIEKVAALRRDLPIGGEVRSDYTFEEGSSDPTDTATVNRVKMSELFVRPDASLVIYSFMYGPTMEEACPACTSILDSLDGTAPHATQRINLAVVARSPIQRIREHARRRGWRHLRLLSSANNDYNRDYHAEDAKGAQLPLLNVFTRKGGKICHTFCTELFFAPSEPGHGSRHVDMIWPLWNVFDYTPEGRGTNWLPSLEYPS